MAGRTRTYGQRIMRASYTDNVLIILGIEMSGTILDYYFDSVC